MLLPADLLKKICMSLHLSFVPVVSVTSEKKQDERFLLVPFASLAMYKSRA